MEEAPKPSQEELLRTEIRELEIDNAGKKEQIETYKKQLQELAALLGVSIDYAVIKSEITKLIYLEDDNVALKSQLRAVKDSEGKAVGKVFVSMKKEVEKYKESVENLVDSVQTLKSRRNVDKYHPGELFIEATKKWFKSAFAFIPRNWTKLSQFVSVKLLRRKRG